MKKTEILSALILALFFAENTYAASNEHRIHYNVQWPQDVPLLIGTCSMQEAMISYNQKNRNCFILQTTDYLSIPACKQFMTNRDRNIAEVCYRDIKMAITNTIGGKVILRPFDDVWNDYVSTTARNKKGQEETAALFK